MQKYFLWKNISTDFSELFKIENSVLKSLHKFNYRIFIEHINKDVLKFYVGRENEKKIKNESKSEIIDFDRYPEVFNKINNHIVTKGIARGIAGIIENHIMGWQPRNSIELEYKNNFFMRNYQYLNLKEVEKKYPQKLFIVMRDDFLHFWGKETRKYFIDSPVRLIGISSETFAKSICIMNKIYNIEKNIFERTNQTITINAYERQNGIIRLVIIQFERDQSILKLKSMNAIEKENYFVGSREGELYNNGIDVVLFRNMEDNAKKELLTYLEEFTTKETIQYDETKGASFADSGANLLANYLDKGDRITNQKPALFFESYLYFPLQTRIIDEHQKTIYAFPIVSSNTNDIRRKAFKPKTPNSICHIVVEIAYTSPLKNYIIRSFETDLPDDKDFVITQSVNARDATKPKLNLEISSIMGDRIDKFEIEFPRYFY